MILPFDLRWLDLIDIAIVAILLYYVIYWIQGTRAVTLLRGLMLIFIVYVIGRVFNLFTVNWMFDKFATVIVVVLIIVFQPELRRTLERFGRGKIIGQLGLQSATQESRIVRHIIRSVEMLSENKVGGIIVLERLTGLSEYLESGVRLDATISAELLYSIFSPRSALHDGAVIIQGERIVGAGCLLPLSESRLIDKRLGTRHRAAIGVSEISDSLSIVVSEKSGTISIAENGYLTRFLNREMLEEKLFNLYKGSNSKSESILWPWKKRKAS